MEKLSLQNEKNTKLHISVSDLMDVMPSKGTDGIRSSLSDVDYIVSLKDLGAMPERMRKSAEIYKLENPELFSMLRGATNGNGQPVYTNANFEITKCNVSEIFAVQTFVSEEKLSAFTKREQFLEDVGIGRSKGSGSYIIKMGTDEKLAAILIPPVLLEYKKSGFAQPISKVSKRLMENNQIIIRQSDSNTVFDLEGALKDLKRAMSMSNTVPVIKDGTHRAYMSNIKQEPLTVVRISDQEEEPTNIPIRFEKVLVASVKPSPDDRYPGNTPSAIADLKKLGIDA